MGPIEVIQGLYDFVKHTYQYYYMSSPRTIVYTAQSPESPSGSVPEYTAPLANSDMFYNFLRRNRHSDKPHRPVL